MLPTTANHGMTLLRNDVKPCIATKDVEISNELPCSIDCDETPYRAWTEQRHAWYGVLRITCRQFSHREARRPKGSQSRALLRLLKVRCGSSA